MEATVPALNNTPAQLVVWFIFRDTCRQYIFISCQTIVPPCVLTFRHQFQHHRSIALINGNRRPIKENSCRVNLSIFLYHRQSTRHDSLGTELIQSSGKPRWESQSVCAISGSGLLFWAKLWYRISLRHQENTFANEIWEHVRLDSNHGARLNVWITLRNI